MCFSHETAICYYLLQIGAQSLAGSGSDIHRLEAHRKVTEVVVR